MLPVSVGLGPPVRFRVAPLPTVKVPPVLMPPPLSASVPAVTLTVPLGALSNGKLPRVLVPVPPDFWKVPELLKAQQLPPLVVSAVPFCWMSNRPVLFSVAPLSKNRVLKLVPGVVWVMVPALFNVPLAVRLLVPLRVM